MKNLAALPYRAIIYRQSSQIKQISRGILPKTGAALFSQPIDIIGQVQNGFETVNVETPELVQGFELTNRIDRLKVERVTAVHPIDHHGNQSWLKTDQDRRHSPHGTEPIGAYLRHFIIMNNSWSPSSVRLPSHQTNLPLSVKTNPSASENKSDAEKKLGGQPENDQDARDAGLPSATSTSKPKKTDKTTKQVNGPKLKSDA